MSDFEVMPIKSQDRLDLYREVYEAAKAYRELAHLSGVPIERDRKAAALLDLAILNVEEFDND